MAGEDAGRTASSEAAEGYEAPCADDLEVIGGTAETASMVTNGISY
jgi:hypothetical protein